MTVKKIYDLPCCDSRKSFYGKATVIEEEDGTILLKSYDTIVGKIVDGIFYRLWSGYSATTMRHVNSFLKFFGVYGGGKKWWDSLEVA